MNTLSPELLAEIYKQQSGDAFLTLLTITHPDIPTPIRLVNNTEDIVSNSLTFSAFPFKIVLPVDDGEKAREVALELDNVSLELIDTIRSISDPLEVKLEMILASIPDDIQLSLEELKIGNLSYDAYKITGRLYQDDFLTAGMTSEIYSPQLYPGLF